MKKNIPTIVITEIPNLWSYFQYFLLAFYTLEKKGKIKLKFKTDLAFNLSRILPYHSLCLAIVDKIKKISSKPGYNLRGYISVGGKRKRFCIDVADTPYIFDINDLNEVDCYFKMQCPKELKREGFYLTDSVYIPYQSHQKRDDGTRTEIPDINSYASKIFPLMVGFRRLSLKNSYKEIKKGYDNYCNSQFEWPRKKAMCYFGNAQGPRPNKNVIVPDVNNESDLMGYYTELNHPNEKRQIVADILNSLGPNYDARIISEGNADSDAKKREDLIVPIEKFCQHIAKFQYNINVSGYRKSIPNRFIESFVVGTAIFTDKLSLKWYKPFGKEVIETEEMGYTKKNSIDWRKIQNDLINLPEVAKIDVLSAFISKWAPEPLGNYILETLQSTFK